MRVTARFDDLTPGGVSFELSNPTAVLVACDTSDVTATIDQAEAAALSGSWVAGYVSYEAAPAFDPALQVKPSRGSVPLAWFAVFADRANVPPIVGPPDPAPAKWELDCSAQRHAQAVAQIKELLAAGETYQVNLTALAHAASTIPSSLYACHGPRPGGRVQRLSRYRLARGGVRIARVVLRASTAIAS